MGFCCAEFDTKIGSQKGNLPPILAGWLGAGFIRGGQTSLEGLLLNVHCILYLGGKHAVESWVVSSPKDSFGEKAALKSGVELVRESLSTACCLAYTSHAKSVGSVTHPLTRTPNF